MSSTDSEQITDEALASSISDDGRLSSESSQQSDEGIVEAGIPPPSNDPTDSVELNEEPFSVSDFDADIVKDESPASNQASENLKEGSIEELSNPSPPILADSSDSTIIEEGTTSSATGQVAEFRKTLSALSRQLEVDRLTFLYQQLQADGNELPTLDRIASDIRGDSPLHPQGGQDLYSKRPLARLQGWISGLSFGVGRRAKKFSR